MTYINSYIDSKLSGWVGLVNLLWLVLGMLTPLIPVFFHNSEKVAAATVVLAVVMNIIAVSWHYWRGDKVPEPTVNTTPPATKPSLHDQTKLPIKKCPGR